MKRMWTIFFLFLFTATAWRCGDTVGNQIEGTVVRGQISSAENMQVFLDKIILNKASMILGKAELDGSGKFELTFPDGLEAGVYNLRIGVQKFNIALDGTEGIIDVSGDLSNIKTHNLQIKGSQAANVLSDTWQKLINRQFAMDDIVNFVDTTSNAFSASYLTYSTLPLNDQALRSISIQQLETFIPVHEKAISKLSSRFQNIFDTF